MFGGWAKTFVCGLGLGAFLIGCKSETASIGPMHGPTPQAEMTLASNRDGRAVLVNDAVISTPPVSREQIIEWSVRGVNDDAIIDKIERSNCDYKLSASEEIHLRDAGVSDEVIRAMKATAG